MMKEAVARPELDAGLASEVNDLTARHRELERQIAVLDRHLALSAEEQLQRTRLKKEKLRVKDRLLLLEARAAAHHES